MILHAPNPGAQDYMGEPGQWPHVSSSFGESDSPKAEPRRAPALPYVLCSALMGGGSLDTHVCVLRERCVMRQCVLTACAHRRD